MVFDEIAPGIQLVGRFGNDQVGIWLLHYQDECMILEMPPATDKDPCSEPWKQVAVHIARARWCLRFISATHDQPDHFKSYPQFHAEFPDVPIIVSRYFSQKGDLRAFITPEDLATCTIPAPSVASKGAPIHFFDGESFETALAGEPLFLLHAPKYSKSDTLVVFRGCMITADWWLGPGDPNWNNIPAAMANASIDFIEGFLEERNYAVHSIFSAHADDFRRGIQLKPLMESSRRPD